MDFESERMDQEQPRPDNLVWIEQVIMNNLDASYDPVTDEVLVSVTPSSTSNTVAVTSRGEVQPEPLQQHDIKLMISEIEMRDENYFGGDRVGTLSRLVAARIKYTVDGDDSERLHFWIIKMPSIQPQERELARVFDVYRREICFYTDILPSMKLWVDSQYIDQLIEFSVPNCYYGKFLRQNDSEPDMEILDHILEAESLLVLEDLRAAGFGKKFISTGMEISEVFAATDEICKFHAVSYCMQKKSQEKQLHWNELMRPIEFVKLYTVMFHKGFELFKIFLSNRTDEPDADEIMRAMTKLNSEVGKVLLRLLTPSPTFPNVLVHMDLWSDNLLFHVKEDDAELPFEDADLDCVIIDWQMVSLGKPSHDIALLTLLSMDPDVRRDNSHLILQYYYQLFEKTLGYFDLEIPFSYDQLITEFTTSCLLALIMTIASMDVVLVEEATQTRLLEAIRDLMQDEML